MRYFDQDLVLFRTEAGEVALLDAFCPHLGAHLGHGGQVKGDCIQCPFHGWVWSADGSLSEIPYAPEESRHVQLQRWETREIDGLMVAWYDGYGRPPFWEWPGIPEFADDQKHYPVYPQGADQMGIRRIIPQSPVENTPDYHHFMYVHGAGQPGRPLYWEEAGHYLHTRIGFWFGYGKRSTWLTPDGPVEGEIETEAWGLALSNARFKLHDFVTSQLTATTPVDQEQSQLFCTITCTREPGSDDPEPTGKAARDARVPEGPDPPGLQHLGTSALPGATVLRGRGKAALRPVPAMVAGSFISTSRTCWSSATRPRRLRRGPSACRRYERVLRTAALMRSTFG